MIGIVDGKYDENCVHPIHVSNIDFYIEREMSIILILIKWYNQQRIRRRTAYLLIMYSLFVYGDKSVTKKKTSCPLTDYIGTRSANPLYYDESGDRNTQKLLFHDICFFLHVISAFKTVTVSTACRLDSPFLNISLGNTLVPLYHSQ